MQKLLKLSLAIFTASLFLLCGCCKNNDMMVNATITGEDYRKCMCCGGYYVQLPNNQEIRAINVVENNVISNVFPIDVKITYEKTTSCPSSENVIKITAIKKR